MSLQRAAFLCLVPGVVLAVLAAGCRESEPSAGCAATAPTAQALQQSAEGPAPDASPLGVRQSSASDRLNGPAAPSSATSAAPATAGPPATAAKRSDGKVAEQVVDLLGAEWALNSVLRDKLNESAIEGLATAGPLTLQEKLAWGIVLASRLPTPDLVASYSRLERISNETTTRSHLESFVRFKARKLNHRTEPQCSAQAEFEIKLNNALKPEDARLIVETGRLLEATRTAELVKSRDKIRGLLGSIVETDPGLARTISQAGAAAERATAGRLGKSWDRARTLIQQARKE